MAKEWRGINDFYFVKRKKEEKEPEPVDINEKEEQQSDNAVEVKLSNPQFIKPEDGYQPNKPCKMQVSAEFMEETARKRVTFDVYSSYKVNELKEYSGLEGFIKDGVAVAEIKYLPLNEDYAHDYDKAEDATYGIRFVASHTKGEKPVESEVLVMPYSGKTDVDFIEIPDILFHLNSAVPCLDKDAVFLNAIVAAFNYVSDNSQKELVIFGHTDKSGDVSFNMDLSEKRVCAIKAILDGDADTFADIINDTSFVSDIQQILNTLDVSYGWSTDCGKVDDVLGPATKKGIETFQIEYNYKYSKDIKIDGVMGTETWRAVFYVYRELIETQYKISTENDSMPDISYGYEGKGIYACGPWFPVEDVKSSYYSKKCRRVEIAFYEKDKAPELKVPKEPEKEIKKEECSVYNENLCTLSPISFEPVEVIPGDVSIAFFFDGTGRNEEIDRPRGTDSNIAKLHELYDEELDAVSGIYSRKKHYHIGVGTDKEKWYDDWLDAFLLGPAVWSIKNAFTDKTLNNISGLGTGSGGKSRINEAFKQLSEFVKIHKNVKQINIDVFGFSRGAALARHFVNLIHENGIIDRKATPIDSKEMKLYTDGKYHTVEIPVFPKFNNINVRFLGIFDTVGSFGLGGNDINLGYALDVHKDRVQKVVHFTAEHEYRSMFDSTSIKSLAVEHDKYQSYAMNRFMQTKPLPSNMVERAFIGAHTDIGGGYQPVDKDGKHNELSRIPLYAMVDEAIKMGVPLQYPEEFKSRSSEHENRFKKAFSIPEDLKNIFNARNNQMQYESFTEEDTSYFKEIHDKYIHDSRYFIDGESQTRDIFFHGVY